MTDTTTDAVERLAQDVLCRLMEAMNVHIDDDWAACAAALRAMAEEAGE